MRNAKQIVEDYKTKAEAMSSEEVPGDITSLIGIIAERPDLCQNAERTITLLTNYPFLLRTNWAHDRWGGSKAIIARKVNKTTLGKHVF